jgi:hypothetical protein
MKKPITVTSLAAALAALSGVPAQQASAAVNTSQDEAAGKEATSKTAAEVGNLTYQVGNDLFGITVKQAADGTLIAQHASHSSHSSHRSHSSHSSSRY